MAKIQNLKQVLNLNIVSNFVLRASNFIRRFCGKDGFTLMELVLVIAILGIIAGLGMGSYANFLRQGSLDSAANEIVASLRKAQTNSQASSDGYGWGVEFDTTNKDRYVIFKGSCASPNATTSCGEDADCPTTCDKTTVETFFINSTVEIDPTGTSFGGKSYTVFDRPSGKPKSSRNGDVRIQLKGGSQQKTINVSALGKIE